MKDINLLLLGESGSGKTTFINAIMNYLWYENFETARQSGIIVAAPMTISYTGGDGKSHRLQAETNRTTEAKHTNIKEYFADLKGSRIRLIDSPGYGESNDEDFDAIFKQIQHLKELHGVCFFVKSSLSRTNQLFEYCIRQTLGVLDVPIVKNIVFIFTRGRSVQFNPSVGKTVLTGCIESIKSKRPFIEIPLHNNIFCVENESILNLLTASYGATKLRPDTLLNCAKSWEFSLEQCRRLIEHVQRVPPYNFSIPATITALENFVDTKAFDFFSAIESNYSNVQKCRRLKKRSDLACRLIHEVQHQLKSSLSVAEMSKKHSACNAPQIPPRQTNMQNSKREVETSKYLSDQKCLLTDDDSETDKSKVGVNVQSNSTRDRNSKNNFNSLPTTIQGDSASGSSNTSIQYTQVQTTSKTDLMEGDPTKTKVDTGIQVKMNTLVQILNEQNRFISKFYDMMETQKFQVHNILRDMAKFSLFLESNANHQDVYEKQFKQLLSAQTSRDAENAVEDLMSEYKKAKEEVSKNRNLDLTEENIDATIKKFSNLQIDVFSSLFNK